MTNDGRFLSQSFEVRFNVEIRVESDGSDLIFTFHYIPAAFQEEVGVPEARIPLRMFCGRDGQISSDRLSQFYAWVMTAFQNTKTVALQRDFQLHFLDTIKLLVASSSGSEGSISRAISDEADLHREVVADSLSRMMQTDLSRRPKHSRYWTPVTLTLALLEVKTSLGPGGVFNYKNAHRIIKDRHPDTAPASPEALKKLVTRLGVDWKAIKAHSPQLSGRFPDTAQKGH